MQELTKNAIRKIQKETKHVLAVADFDDIERIEKLAETVKGVSSVERRLLMSPFELGGIKFYPLTVAKSLWINEKVIEWDISDAQSEEFMFWALTIPLGAESLEKYYTKKAADKAMRKNSRRMDFSHEELSEICNRCFGVSEEVGTGKKRKSTLFGGMVACLIREFGQSPSYWLHDVPIEMISELYSQILIKAHNEDSASRSSSAKGGKAVAPRMDSSMEALAAFRAEVNKLKEKWSA